MTIQEIYQKFDAIGCLTFATINQDNQPEARIAHLRAYDEDGIYFMTMYTKEFYRQLKTNGSLAVCGLCASTAVSHDAEGMPVFEAGYAMRMTGKVREVPMEEIKAKQNPLFTLCIKDQEKYPAMVVFCITEASGDIFDYDFEQQTRDNKLERTYFSYHGAPIRTKGLTIDQASCIGCGLCQKHCSFLAISQGENGYTIDTHRCDECGDCAVHCPVNAIH